MEPRKEVAIFRRRPVHLLVAEAACFARQVPIYSPHCGLSTTKKRQRRWEYLSQYLHASLSVAGGLLCLVHVKARRNLLSHMCWRFCDSMKNGHGDLSCTGGLLGRR